MRLHDWLELDFNGTSRRWCCTPIAKGGCGACQVHRERDSHDRARWFPPVKDTCTAELAKIVHGRTQRLTASRRRRRQRGLWFWAVENVN